MRSHHDVLGIRPNAGREEIELAYKGRRSQYHPDRYAQSDQETQAWATACMQEVNAAYEALINGRPSAAPEAAASRQPASQATTPSPMSLGQALRAHPISKMAMSRIYIAPNIPLKKLHNALESYGHGLKPSDVLVLLDDTIFSSGKDGLLVTERELRVKEAFNPPETFALDGIALGIRGGDLYVNNRRVRDFNITEASEVQELVQALNAWLTRTHTASTPTREAASDDGSIEQLLRHATQGYLGDVYEMAQVRLQRSLALDDLESLRDAGESGLIVNAIRFTGELADIVASGRREPVSQNQRACLMSDAVRLELLLYQMVWINATLMERYGRNEQDLQRDMSSFMMAIIFPVLAIVQDNALPNVANAREALIGTPLFAAMERRVARYVDFAVDPNADQGVALFTCLADPVAMSARSVTRTPGMGQQWARQIADACSSADLRRLTDAMHTRLGDCASAYRGVVG